MKTSQRATYWSSIPKARQEETIVLKSPAGTSFFYPTADPAIKVPVMTVSALPSPMADSLDISLWFCQRYPRLLPEKYQTKIRDLLAQIHSIEALSLSAERPEQPEEDIVDPACDELLAKSDISDIYRQALEYKKEV
jgi:hypothetical protein